MFSSATSFSSQVWFPFFQLHNSLSILTDGKKGIGMVLSAQWELVLGNTYAYTVLSAFGFFYGGFGAIITPLFGVQAAYGTDIAGYNNALGFFVLSKWNRTECLLVLTLTVWAVWNFFFLLGSLPL